MHRQYAVGFLAAFMAQAAEVAGRVYDPSSATVPKAQIVLRAASARFTATSGEAGEFLFDNVPAGSYELEVLMPGFVRFQRRVNAMQGSRAWVGALLKLGELQESVAVTAPGQVRVQQQPPRRVLVGGAVQPPRLLQQVKAAYPETARAEGREGNVTLLAVIGVDGRIVNVAVLPGADADFTAAAEQAVRQWTYEPTRLNGKPVETVTTVEMSFRLGG